MRRNGVRRWALVDTVLDTDILVDHLRGYEPAKRFLRKIEGGKIRAYVSVITRAELFSGRGVGEVAGERKVRELLDITKQVNLTADIAEKAGEFSRECGCRLIDSVIAATAFFLGLPIYTRNVKHFRNIKVIKVVKPYSHKDSTGR